MRYSATILDNTHGKPMGRYYIGIAGTTVLIIMYFITRVPSPITNRAAPINSTGVLIEVSQFIYISFMACPLPSETR